MRTHRGGQGPDRRAGGAAEVAANSGSQRGIAEGVNALGAVSDDDDDMLDMVGIGRHSD